MRASARGSSSPASGVRPCPRGWPKLVTTSSIGERLAMATPFQRPSPWWASWYPRLAKKSCGTSLSASFVSCISITSGRARSSHQDTLSRRALSELTFQVAMRMGRLYPRPRPRPGASPRRRASDRVASPATAARGEVERFVVSFRSRLLLLVVLVAPASALAEGTTEGERRAEASVHLKRGAQLIDAEDLTGALAEFESAYRLVPSPSILHNFGVVYQGLGRNASALEAFERFLAEAPKPQPAIKEHALKAVQTLRERVAELQVGGEDGASIFVDGRRVGLTPQSK